MLKHLHSAKRDDIIKKSPKEAIKKEYTGKNDIIFDDSSKIPVSRRAYPVVNEAFINYYKRVEGFK